ncbi:hypothetical protein BJF92_11245 [Rhizobium rhizosphaerae]|uniref:Uncharacterized protein n=2 Tax=Xaviernesmea rhizosphaerae TaxID=1672749 RepID=A0A1Q9AMU5_9HYPH|nr:hypothetical protein BJF92_11245 [Xaviernesmea rhizosphaerae]
MPQMRQAHKDWPTFKDDSATKVERAFLALDEDDRKLALDRVSAFLRKREALGQNSGSFGDYLRRRLWEGLTEQDLRDAAPACLYSRFSRAWYGAVLATLLKPEAPLPRLTRFQQVEIAKGGPIAARILQDRRALYGWPAVHGLYAAKAVKVPAGIAEASRSFVAVPAGSDALATWEAAFRSRGWPWPDLGTHQWHHFPPLEGLRMQDVDAALAAFERALSGDRTGDDADQA